MYIEILKDIYTDSSVTVHLHKESEKIRIKRGVRQGDTISPKLFTATLESIFRRLNWENKGVKIDGEFLSNLRFADDIFLCTETPQELQQMLQELSDESRRMGLKINIAKTKVMVVDNTPINVNNVLIENVPGYVYLGQHYSLKEKNQDKEIQRRIMAGWVAYAKHRDIFKSNLAICLKRQVYNSYVLLAMTYGAETRVGVKYNWSSIQVPQVPVIKYKYKYFAFSPIKYSSTDTPSTSTSVNIGWFICTGNTRAVFPGKYRPVQ